jgi:hypothetical protein
LGIAGNQSGALFAAFQHSFAGAQIELRHLQRRAVALRATLQNRLDLVLRNLALRTQAGTHGDHAQR